MKKTVKVFLVFVIVLYFAIPLMGCNNITQTPFAGEMKLYSVTTHYGRHIELEEFEGSTIFIHENQRNITIDFVGVHSVINGTFRFRMSRRGYSAMNVTFTGEARAFEDVYRLESRIQGVQVFFLGNGHQTELIFTFILEVIYENGNNGQHNQENFNSAYQALLNAGFEFPAGIVNSLGTRSLIGIRFCMTTFVADNILVWEFPDQIAFNIGLEVAREYSAEAQNMGLGEFIVRRQGRIIYYGNPTAVQIVQNVIGGQAVSI